MSLREQYRFRNLSGLSDGTFNTIDVHTDDNLSHYLINSEPIHTDHIVDDESRTNQFWLVNRHPIDELRDVILSGLTGNNMLVYDASATGTDSSGNSITGAFVNTNDIYISSITHPSSGGIVEVNDTIDMNTNDLNGLSFLPATGTSAVSSAYLEQALVNGSRVKPNCRLATTANITLSGIQVIDGVTGALDDRILVKDQTDATENGIYDMTGGSWVRSEDMDNIAPESEIVNGALTVVEEGTENLGFQFRITSVGTGTNQVHQIGIDNINWDASHVNLLTSAPITKTADTIGLDWNTTNLKLTTDQLNTIQDINTTADVQFNSVDIEQINSSGDGTLVVNCDSNYQNTKGLYDVASVVSALVQVGQIEKRSGDTLITVSSTLDLENTNNINNVLNLDVQTITNDISDVLFNSSINMNSNDITGAGNLQVSSISTQNVDGYIDISDSIDMLSSGIITNCNSIKTGEVDTPQIQNTGGVSVSFLDSIDLGGTKTINNCLEATITTVNTDIINTTSSALTIDFNDTTKFDFSTTTGFQALALPITCGAITCSELNSIFSATTNDLPVTCNLAFSGAENITDVNNIYVNGIYETTPANKIQLYDDTNCSGTFTVNTINERTTNNGVVIENITIGGASDQIDFAQSGSSISTQTTGGGRTNIYATSLVQCWTGGVRQVAFGGSASLTLYGDLNMNNNSILNLDAPTGTPAYALAVDSSNEVIKYTSVATGVDKAGDTMSGLLHINIADSVFAGTCNALQVGKTSCGLNYAVVSTLDLLDVCGEDGVYIYVGTTNVCTYGLSTINFKRAVEFDDDVTVDNEQIRIKFTNTDASPQTAPATGSIVFEGNSDKNFITGYSTLNDRVFYCSAGFNVHVINGVQKGFWGSIGLGLQSGKLDMYNNIIDRCDTLKNNTQLDIITTSGDIRLTPNDDVVFDLGNTTDGKDFIVIGMYFGVPGANVAISNTTDRVERSSTCSRKIKTEIVELDADDTTATDVIKNLPTYSYRYKTTAELQEYVDENPDDKFSCLLKKSGFCGRDEQQQTYINTIAEEVADRGHPELVKGELDCVPDMQFDQLTGYLLQTCKNLIKRVEYLEGKLNI